MESIKAHYRTTNKIINSYRFFSIIVVTVSFLVCCFFGYVLYDVSQNNIMVVDGQGDILSASKSSEDELLKIESDNHIRLFYSSFFSYDKSNYKKRCEKGLFLVGKSGQNLYQTYKLKGWYDVVINNDLIIESSVQSIKFDNKENQLLFEAFGVQKITRGNIIETRNLNIKGSISKHPNGRQIEINPHGLLIDNLIILDNSVIKKDDLKSDELTLIEN